MTYKIPVNKEQYYSVVLQAFNPVLGLSKKEIAILNSMLSKDKKEFNTENREMIRLDIDIDKYSLNNYIGQLKKKDIIGVVEKKLVIKQGLIDNLNKGVVGYEFKIK